MRLCGSSIRNVESRVGDRHGAGAPEGGRRPTIRDVAAVAGVSRGTVSRVLNGADWVSPASREAVEKAIVSTGYTTNHAARSLATGRSNSVAFLLTEPQQLLFEDPTFSLLLRGTARALAQRGVTLVLMVADGPAERDSASRYVRAGHVDGVLLISGHEVSPLRDALLDAGVPTVSSGMTLRDHPGIRSVSVEEAESAATMTRHLRERGHRRIALITGPDDTPGGRHRLAGFRDAMDDDFDPALVERVTYSRASGDEAMQRLLDRATGRIDAVFAASDIIAAGALSALRRAGLRVPDDIALAGFDDSGLAATLEPALTTMRQPWDEISATMVDLLLDLVDGRPRDSVVLPAELVVRDST